MSAGNTETFPRYFDAATEKKIWFLPIMGLFQDHFKMLNFIYQKNLQRNLLTVRLCSCYVDEIGCICVVKQCCHFNSVIWGQTNTVRVFGESENWFKMSNANVQHSWDFKCSNYWLIFNEYQMPFFLLCTLHHFSNRGTIHNRIDIFGDFENKINFLSIIYVKYEQTIIYTNLSRVITARFMLDGKLADYYIFVTVLCKSIWCQRVAIQ